MTLTEVTLDGRVLWTNPDMGGTVTGEATADTATEAVGPGHPNYRPPVDLSDDTNDDTNDDTVDYKAEAEKWQALARKHEDRAKTNAAAAKELEQVKQSTMSDLEKAVEVARKEGRAETLREVGTERVKDAIRLNVNGRVADVEEFIDGVNLERFVGDDGQPDRDAIAAWVDKIAPPREELGFPDLGQGSRPDQHTALNGDPLLRDIKSKLHIR